MFRFISFGSGSSGNCYYLFTESDGLLIDAGVGSRTLKKYFREYGLQLSHVRRILITHDHADHIKSVGRLSRELDIPVYATPKVHEGIERNYSVHNKVAPQHIKRIEPGKAFSIGDFGIEAFTVPHDSLDNVGYQIKHQDIVFCLMTDVGHVTDEMKNFIQHTNYLVIEANHDEEMLKNGPYPDHLKIRVSGPNGHLCNRDCGEALAQNATQKLKHVWLCHLSEENNHPVLAQKTIETILRSHGIVVGKDFQLNVLKRKTPENIIDLV